MIVCKKQRIIFYHIPRTAGSSIKTILINEFEGEKINVHIPYRNSHLYISNLEDYVKFAVVRNPYGRMVSWYHTLLKESKGGKKREAIQKPKSFEDFVKNQKYIYKTKRPKLFQLWDTQKSFIGDGDKLGVNKILRFENIQEDFNYFCKRFFNGTFELPHLKKYGVQNDYQQYYTPELQEIVYNKLKEDFDYFGYKK